MVAQHPPDLRPDSRLSRPRKTSGFKAVRSQARDPRRAHPSSSHQLSEGLAKLSVGVRASKRDPPARCRDGGSLLTA
eukprot:2764425-Amphidinium_carterae.1